MSAIWAICTKDIRLLVRERMAFFFAFFFPLLIAVFFGTIFAGSGSSSGSGEDSGKIDVLLVDEDNTPGSQAFAKTLIEASELKVTASLAPQDAEGSTPAKTAGAAKAKPLTRTEAVDLVRKAEYSAAIVLPKGFGATRDGLFFNSGSTIGLAVDPSRRAESGMLEGLLTKYGFQQMQTAFQDPAAFRNQLNASRLLLKTASSLEPTTRANIDQLFSDLDRFMDKRDAEKKASKPDPSATPTTEKPAKSTGMGGWQPIRIESISIARPASKPADGTTGETAPVQPTNAFSITFPQGIIWGVMGCALSFSISLVTERTRGTLVRLRVAPISGLQVLMGKALACFLTTQAVCVMMLIVGVAFFHVRPVNWPSLVLAVLATGVCFVGIMMLLASLSPSERGGNSLGWGVLLVFSMIGGGMIPLFFMPSWMKVLSVFSPIRWSIQAIEGGIWRDLSFVEMLLPLGILLGVGLLGFFFGVRVFARSPRSA